MGVVADVVVGVGGKRGSNWSGEPTKSLRSVRLLWRQGRKGENGEKRRGAFDQFSMQIGCLRSQDGGQRVFARRARMPVISKEVAARCWAFTSVQYWVSGWQHRRSDV